MTTSEGILHGTDPRILADPRSLIEEFGSIELRQELLQWWDSSEAQGSIPPSLEDWVTSQAEPLPPALLLAIMAVHAFNRQDPIAQDLLNLKPQIDSNTVPSMARTELLWAAALSARERDEFDAFIELAVQSLQIIDKSMPVFEQRRDLLGLNLAYRGTLADIKNLAPEATKLDTADIDFGGNVPLWPVIEFIDAVECGRSSSAESALAPMVESGICPAGFEEIVAVYDCILQYMDHQRSMGAGKLPVEVLEEEECQIFSAIGNGDMRTLHTVIEESDYEEIEVESSMFGFRSIRLALVLCDSGLARSLLDRRRRAGSASWIDEVMWMRVALLEGEDGTAMAHFHNARKAAVHYGGEGRLQFELSLARETNRFQLLSLADQSDASHHKSTWFVDVSYQDKLQAFTGDPDVLGALTSLNPALAPVIIDLPVGGDAPGLARILHEHWGGGTLREISLSAFTADQGVALAGELEQSAENEAQGETIVLHDVSLLPLQLWQILEMYLRRPPGYLGPRVILFGVGESYACGGQRVAIPPIADSIRTIAQAMASVWFQGLVVAEDALAMLDGHDWSGNHLELRDLLLGVVTRFPDISEVNASHMQWWALERDTVNG